MQEVLEFILKNITTSPDDVSVETSDEGGVTNYTISVHSDDVGRIIGKEGKVIKAIRTIMRVIAIQKGVRVRVSVLSDKDEKRPVTSEEVVVEQNEAPEPEEVAEETEETVEIVDTPEPEVEVTPEPATETPPEDSLTVEV